MGRNRVKKWNGVRGSGGHSRGGLKTGDTRADILNEILTNLDALRFGGFGGAEGCKGGAENWRSTDVMCTGVGVGERGGGKKSGEDVVPVVECGRERGILEARREKGRWSKRGGAEKG